jgi:type IV pilus assembly protein PilM
MKTNLFGLDIGTTTLKAVWLTGDANHPTLHACMSLPTPEKGMMSESVQDQDEMAVAIRKLVTDAKISTNLVNIALSENQVFTKVIDMPVLSDKELASAIYWEAEQYIPAPLSTITLDWKVLHRPTASENEQKMQVLLVGAPTNLIKKYQNVVELAGLTLASIETEILSVIRSVVVGENFPTSLIINVGALSTSLAIIKNGIIVFTYSIPLGGIAMNRAIANEFGFNTEQAEEYKKTYGVLDEKLGGKIGKAIEPILTALLAEIKKALAFYTDKYKNESPITQIILAGGTARLPGIDLFFVQNVGIETVIANPWKLHNVQNAPKEIIDTTSDYAIAFGLAIKDYE